MDIKLRAWVTAFRQWRFKTFVLCLLPWLLVLAVSEWRAVFDEQFSGNPSRYLEYAGEQPWHHAALDTCREFLGIEKNYSALAKHERQLLDSTDSRHYKALALHMPQEIWPRAGWLKQEINTVLARASQEPDQYDFDGLPLAIFPAPSPRGNWFIPEILRLPKTIAPDEAETKRIRALAAFGRTREPDNAFYDVMLAYYELTIGNETGGLKSLARAGKCTRYEPHFYDVLAVVIKRKDQEKNLSTESKTRLWWRPFHSGALRQLAEHTAYIVAREKRRGRRLEALQLTKAVSHIGALVTGSRTSSYEKNDGRYLQLTIWRYAGGWEDLDAFQKHLSSLPMRRVPDGDLGVAAKSAAAYAKQQGQTDLAREILNQAKQTASLKLSVERDDPSNIYYRRLVWQWRAQFFLMGQPLVACAALWFVRLLRWKAPQVEFRWHETVLPVVLVLVLSAGLQCLVERIHPEGISWIPHTDRDMFAWSACLGPAVLLAGWWVIVGMWRSQETLMPRVKFQMNSGENWFLWRIVGMAMRLSPLIATVTLGALYWSISRWVFRPKPVEAWLQKWTGWGVEEVVQWPAAGVMIWAGIYILVVLVKWRWSRSAPVRAEVGRSLWGLSRCLVLIVLLSGWGYVAANIVFTPTKLSLARALGEIEHNGYQGNGERSLWSGE